jgi:hypothetical protein
MVAFASRPTAAGQAVRGSIAGNRVEQSLVAVAQGQQLDLPQVYPVAPAIGDKLIVTLSGDMRAGQDRAGETDKPI